MRDTLLWIAAFVTFAFGACAQDISGDWHGEAGRYQYVLHVDKPDSGGQKATLTQIDQDLDWQGARPVTAWTLADSKLTFSVEEPDGTFEGEVSPDGASIRGTWRQGPLQKLQFLRATKETEWRDESPHKVQFITVDQDVKLEVLDWGGTGRPLVLLSGLGNTAHIFDKFALKLNSTYHVYGVTRRGFGESSHPQSGYGADRLGDDVLTVIDALKLNRPVLAGHSIAGEELSSIGSRYPEKVAGLIYLDAGYPYAYYDRSRGALVIDLQDLRSKLAQLAPGATPTNPRDLVQELLETSLPAFERDLREAQKDFASAPLPPPSSGQPQRPALAPSAILAGQQKYTEIRGPILAIFAMPHAAPAAIRNNPDAVAAADARDEAANGQQVTAFENGLPKARVVRIPHANHYVFLSNEADVLREMNSFIGSLPN
jgi:non-heme chloroperoxidase